MRVLLTPKHVRFISLVLGWITFIIVVLFLLPGCATEPGAWAATWEEEAIHPPMGRVVHALEVVRR